MKYPIFSSTSLVGLDVQPDAVRLIQLKKGKKGFYVERIDRSALPAGIFVEGKIKQWDLLCSSLTKLVRRLSLKNQATAISLSANMSRMQNIQLPAGMQDSQIETEIQAHVARDFPNMTEALCMDFKAKPHKEPGYADIFFIVTRQEYLWQYVNCVNSAGLKVKIVDIDIYAMKRAATLALMPVLMPNEAQAMVYVMSNIASFMIFDDHDIFFNQQWDIIDAIDFHSQLKSRIQIFFSTFAHITVRRLAVCASAPFSTWVTQECCASWDWEIYCLDPFRHIKAGSTIDIKKLNDNGVDFMIACGLAMREVPQW